ncbi:MAG: AAA family ATPase [Porticoccaceae bacterium]
MAARWIEQLLNPACYPHPVGRIELIETHISWVILTGDYAYKIKKPVNFGFVDFSTLDKRQHYCEEELRLNRRFAPPLYQGVIAITGSPQAPRIGGQDEPFDYAVVMRQFDQAALLDRQLAAGHFSLEDAFRLGVVLADQHRLVAVAGTDSPYGSAEAVMAPVRENFDHLRPRLDDPADSALLLRLERWSHGEGQRLAERFSARRAAGCVRECHGDLHLANIARIDGEFMLFDCLEFNAELRFIDIQSELAFVAMDLADRGRPDLANGVVNGYLEQSGDYEGLPLFNYYRVYRALVRAKVALLRAEQLTEPARRQARRQGSHYLLLAAQFTEPRRPWLGLAHGVSGTGKSRLALDIASHTGAIRLRSDAERKRLHGLDLTARGGGAAGLYSAEATRHTFERLAELARAILTAGFAVIVDATFLHRPQRAAFAAIATELAVARIILSITAEFATLVSRLNARAQDPREVSDADLAVLENQLRTQEPLTAAERIETIALSAERLPVIAELVREIERRARQWP